MVSMDSFKNGGEESRGSSTVIVHLADSGSDGSGKSRYEYQGTGINWTAVVVGSGSWRWSVV